MPDPKRSPAGGFTLVEALVALAILGLALLLGMEILLQQPRIQLKLRAHQEAHAALGRTLEGIRAGTVPLMTGTVAGVEPISNVVPVPSTALPKLRAPAPSVRAADGLVLRMTVTPEGTVPGLSRILLTAQYTVRGQLFERRVETMVWRRP